MFLGFTLKPSQNYVVTPHDQDYFTLELQTPPVHAPSDQVKIEFNPPTVYVGLTRPITLFFVFFYVKINSLRNDLSANR